MNSKNNSLKDGQYRGGAVPPLGVHSKGWVNFGCNSTAKGYHDLVASAEIPQFLLSILLRAMPVPFYIKTVR